MLPEQGAALVAVAARQHAIAVRFQNRLCRIPNVGLVVHDEDQLSLSARDFRALDHRGLCFHSAQSGKVNDESRPLCRVRCRR
jgi:hypothetical protein